MYKCTPEMHVKCENSALCHLCDGIRLYKNKEEERKKKEEAKRERQRQQKQEPLRHYSKEKKQGMAFEKKVQNAWNQPSNKSKKKIAKPRLDMEISDIQLSEPSNEGSRDPYRGLSIPSLKKQDKPSAPRLNAYNRSGASKGKNEARRQANSGAMWHSKGDIRVEHALMECKERGTVNGRGEKTITIPKEWLRKQEQEAFEESKPFWYLPFGYKNDDAIYLIKDFNHEVEMIHEIRQLTEEVERLKKLLDEKE